MEEEEKKKNIIAPLPVRRHSLQADIFESKCLCSFIFVYLPRIQA